MSAESASVHEYIAAQPEPARGILEQVRAVVLRALPDAEELISYKIPTYKIGGRPVLYFAGWRRHYSVYPVTAALRALLEQEPASFTVEKGTIRFPLSEPVPERLIERIAILRAEEVVAESMAKSGRRS